MRSVSRHHVVKATFAMALATVGIVSMGCDAKEADRKAVSQYKQGDYKAAAKGAASPVVQALAARAAANQDLAASLTTFRDLNVSQLHVADALVSLNRLASQATIIYNASAALSGLDPAKSIQTIDNTVQQVKGDNAATWSPVDTDVQIATLAAAAARTNELKDQKAEIERNIAALTQQRDAASADSAKLMAESEAAKGESALQSFRKAVDARQQATSLDIQVKQATASLIPIDQELAEIAAQSKVSAETLGILASFKEQLEWNWRNVQKEASVQAQIAASIFGKGPDDKGGTIVARAARLADLTADQDKLAAQYEEQLKSAASYAKDSVSATEKAFREVGAARSKAGADGLASFALDPSFSRFGQGYADFTLGASKLAQASLAAAKTRAIANVAEIGKTVNQKLPDNLNADTAKKQLDTAIADGSEGLKSASEVFGNVADTASFPDLKKDAQIGQIYALDVTGLLLSNSLIPSDLENSKKAFDEARALRDKLVESGGKLPAVTPSLQGGAPATPASSDVEKGNR